ncbi:MAG: membrane protein insertion efficiency factor YidD [Proteobacteria bacterium]|nr:membrane protein insertion efficiency factor YidD [Pseudomonadota bacterium]MDA1331545.1 membrane protein insertion efficiency factor YidD [Pseudomonadota bacterium]
MIRCYQYLVSPLLVPSCRFSPTCSEYAKESIGRYGCSLGIGLAIKRLCRCQPFQAGGFDPVPQILHAKRES